MTRTDVDPCWGWGIYQHQQQVLSGYWLGVTKAKDAARRADQLITSLGLVY
ncbi:hypothetical protein ACFC1B_07545 [Streptomyces xiamenensis]|uniref:hypothetical protein n=1 Tax=Streptomyces xiamenensis TaxID=408015 RepID=UPI0035E0D2B2